MQKVAVVSGGNGGIGQSCCLRLASDGFSVISLYCHHEDRAKELMARAKEDHLDLRILPCNVADPQDTQRAFDEIHRLYHHVDLLVCAAGISLVQLFQDTDEENWQKVMETNLGGTYRCIRSVLPGMIERKSGCIITVSSIWGETGGSCEVAYSASKAGIIGLTKALAKEAGPSGIRVNCVSPGVIRTPMNAVFSAQEMEALRDETPLNRIGEPEDVADAVSFLASDAASFITGQVLGVSGGFVI